MRHQLPLALLLATTSVACVEDGAAVETTEDVASALEQENGGFDTGDEAPMFDQAPIFDAARIEADAPVADPIASTPEVTTLANAATTTGYRVALVWGQLPPDRNAPAARDWSGNLTLNRGAMIVGRRIGFEPDTDSLHPRTQRDRLDFTSVTRPFADGVVLRVLDPDTTLGALGITYTSADASVTVAFDFTQLETGPIVVDMGGGNSMVMTALRERPATDPACEHGFLRGRWHSLRENLGVYRGVIANADGEVTGHIRGIWGQRPSTGEPVMFGKFIATDGSFRGLVKGTYEGGHFRARWLTSAGDHGVLGGHYREAPDSNGGGFIGRWADSACAPM